MRRCVWCSNFDSLRDETPARQENTTHVFFKNILCLLDGIILLDDVLSAYDEVLLKS